MQDSTLKEKVVKSHLAGVPTRTICEKFNVNRRSVQRWVQKASGALEEVKPLPTVKDKLNNFVFYSVICSVVLIFTYLKSLYQCLRP